MDRRTRPSFWLYWYIFIAVIGSAGKEAFSQSPLEYVPNLPFTAQGVNSYRESLADGTLVQHETRLVQMRDSQGRTRIETFLARDPGCNVVSDRPTTVNLYVPLRRQFIQLVVARKIARVMTFPATGPIPTHGANANAVETTTENLPGQRINGIYAVGKRTTTRIPSDGGKAPDVVDVQESWASPDLKIIVLSKHTSTDPGSDNVMWKIQKLDRSEPDAGLFEIPSDYKIVRATFGSQAGSPIDSSDNKEQPVSQP